MFISFEGIDGAGKSTVFNRLREDLLKMGLGDRVIFTREPGSTKISEAIRKILISSKHGIMDPWTEALLYSAARRQNVVENIEPALKDKKIVLSDRYVDSSIAYQGGGRSLGIKDIVKMNNYAIQKVIPDYIIYLKIDPELSRKRINQRNQNVDRLEKEQSDFFQRISDTYEKLISQNPTRYLIINAEQKPDEVYKDVKGIVIPLIKEAIK